MIRSKKLRDSARGQNCTFQIVGVCNGNSETVVLCHLTDEFGGLGLKSDDISGAFGCSSCHDAVDGRVKSKEYLNHQDLYIKRALLRTIRFWVENDFIKIAGMK